MFFPKVHNRQIYVFPAVFYFNRQITGGFAEKTADFNKSRAVFT